MRRTNRDVAEEIAAQHQARDPHDRSRHVVEEEPAVGHPPDPGHERREGPHDGDEARDHDGLGSVALVELVGAREMLAVQEAHPLLPEHARAHPRSDRVVDAVAQDRGGDQQRHHEPQIQGPEGREGAHREQERVPGQNGSPPGPLAEAIRNRSDGPDPVCWMTSLRWRSRFSRMSIRVPAGPWPDLYRPGRIRGSPRRGARCTVDSQSRAPPHHSWAAAPEALRRGGRFAWYGEG